MAQRLFREERLQQIAERLLTGKKVYVDELAAAFGVSASSIRNDLAELAARGLLTRTHGGAIAAEQTVGRLVMQKPLELRKEAGRAEKEAIGRAAAALVADGDTLMMDGGSTTLYVARHLADKRGLTIVTNAISLLPDLMALPDAQVYVTGGLLDRRLEILLGEIALEALARFRTVKAILGMDGISPVAGLSVVNPAVAAAKRKMMAASDKVIVVCDHSKFDQVCLVPLASFSEIDYLVTDSGTAPAMIEAIRALGPQVIVAPVEL